MNFPQVGYIGLPLDKPQQSVFEKILAALDARMAEPGLYGWYHFLCLAIVVVLCAVVAIKCRRLSDKQVTTILGATAAALILFEIYKQLNFSYDHEEDVWSYSWYAFPFQFCSTPMYVMTAAVLVKNEKFRNCAYSFLATYALFAGAAVMFYPDTVFTETIGINVQTMVHHGTMVVIGVLLYVSGKVKLEHKTLLRALPVFVVLSSLALGMNVLYDYVGDPEQTFNMFFIAPGEEPSLPLVSILLANAPYPLYLCAYLCGFTAAAYAVLLLAMLSAKLYQKATRQAPAPTHKA